MRIDSARLKPLAPLLTAFQTPYFGRLWLSNCLNAICRWTARLALGWLMLELTDSAFWVGLVAGAEGVGQLACGILGGVLVDRLDRRKVLAVVFFLYATVMLILGGLVLMGVVEPWHVLVAALALGALFAVLSPAINVMVYQLAGRERLMNASAALILSFNIARITGSALAGAIIAARGVGPALLVGAGTAVISTLILATVRGRYRSAAPQSAFWAAVGEGFRYVLARDTIRRLLVLSSLVEMFGFSHYAMVPIIARDVLHVGANGLGALSTAAGVGALTGTFLMSAMGTIKHKGKWLRLAAAGAGLTLVAFAFSPWYPVSLVLAFLIGAALVAYDVLLQTLIQLITSDEVRGRVFGLFSLTFGFNSMGGFLSGSLAAIAGAPIAIATGGAVILGGVLGALKSLSQIREDEG